MRTTLYFYDRQNSMIYMIPNPKIIPRRTEKVRINDKYYEVYQLIYAHEENKLNIRCYLK